MRLLPRDERARDCLAIIVLAFLFAAIIRPFQNAPFVDDWVYAWSVENLLAHGRVEVLNYSDNVNVAQMRLGRAGVPAVRLLVHGAAHLDLAAGDCGALRLYLLLREFGVQRRDALLGTATLAVYPIFTLLSATFMTDVPFLSMTVVTSAAMFKPYGAKALDGFGRALASRARRGNPRRWGGHAHCHGAVTGPRARRVGTHSGRAGLCPRAPCRVRPSLLVALAGVSRRRCRMAA